MREGILVLAATAAATAIVAAPAAGRAPAPRHAAAKPFFDVRTGHAAVARHSPASRSAGLARTRETREARADLRRRLGRQGVLDVDPLTGTSRSLLRLDGALSAPDEGDRAAIARGYLRANAAALGLSAADVDALAAPTRVAAPGGLVILRFRQVSDGIPTFDNGVRVALDRAGRVIAVTGSPRHDLRAPSTAPRLDARQALGRLMDDVDVSRDVRVSSGPTGSRRTTRFSTGDTARLVLFGAKEVRLAWHLTYRATPAAAYDAVVDAETGRVLYRANLVKFAAAAKIYPNYPGAPSGGTPEEVDLEALGYLTPGATRLEGPFGRTFSDVDDDDEPQASEETGRTPVGDFGYAFTPFPVPENGCAPAGDNPPCGWDHTDPPSWSVNRQQNAVQGHWFVGHFHDHLLRPSIGFDAASGNFEDDDPVVMHQDDGAATGDDGGPDESHINNANMLTLPDGESPRLQDFLNSNVSLIWRDTNGGDEAATVYHEYGHGLSNRLVIADDGTGALNSPHSGAMGEAWSDWYAQDLLVREGYEPDDPDAIGDVEVFKYSDLIYPATRTQALDCPVGSSASRCPGGDDTGPGGYTFGDFARVAGSPQVHSDGEIWSETLWDLRSRLVAETASQDEGSDIAEALVTGAMRLSPPEPSFLDMRNAIFATDTALFGGSHEDLIWEVFRLRGMGFFAAASSGSDVAPVEDFRAPPPEDTPTGALAGRVSDAETGLPVAGVQVGIAGHTTGPAFQPYLATETGADGRYELTDVPAGTYPKVTVTPSAGFDAVTINDVHVPAGSRETHDVEVARNWAASAGGAEVFDTNEDSGSEFGCGTAEVIDGSTGTVWSTVNPSATPEEEAPSYVTVELPATIDVSAFAMDPSAGCGDGPSSTTKGFRVETSADGTTFATALEGAFAPEDAGRINVIAPTANSTGVKFVRLTLLSPQDDSPGGSGEDWIDFAELQVRGGPPNVLPSGTLAASATRVAPGATVRFDASSFSDPDSVITGYAWDFDGDGSVDRETDEPTTEFAYGAAGRYTAEVAAKDFRGGQGESTTAVEVVAPGTTPPPPPPPPPASPPAPGGGAPAGPPAPRVDTRTPLAGRITASLRRPNRVRIGYGTLAATSVRLRVLVGGKSIGTRTLRAIGDGRAFATVKFRRRVAKGTRITVELRVSGRNGIDTRRFTYRQ